MNPAPSVESLAQRYWVACRHMRSDSEPQRVAGLSDLGALLPAAPRPLAEAIHRTLREEGPALVLAFSPRSPARSAAARA